MPAAFQEVSFFRLTSLMKSTHLVDQTNTIVYIATPFSEGLNGNLVTIACFLQVQYGAGIDPYVFSMLKRTG